MSKFSYSEESPEFVPDLPRDYKGGEGTVTEAVGCLQEDDNGRRFWKSVQLIEMEDGEDHIRTGYYTESGGWQNKPLMLQTEAFSDLVGFAEGKIF
jgi:hypothetical protein